MLLSDIEKHVERVFLEHWDYSGGDPAYFEDKARHVDAFARDLQALTGRPARIEHPANLQNFHCIEVCFTPGISESRDTLSFETVRDRGEVIYLDILASVILPLSEASWRRFSISGHMLDQQSHELLSDTWLATHPEHEEIAYALIELGEKHRLDVLSSDILRRPANPGLRVPFPGNQPAVLRDFIFPGVLD